LYLSKFARLIRDLLESNTKENIVVKEEADILRRYMEMEALRFKKSFTFSVTVDEKISQEQDHIPHMMLQPFIENAIWHGLLPKNGERNLVVAFEAAHNKTIRCIIDDNGIGRAASMKKEATFKKKSLALSFINQRIRLMRKTLKVDCSVDIIDKTNAAGESTGTKVVIVLPVLNK
jgi:LytS/YehU family sensor histidine kinase